MILVEFYSDDLENGRFNVKITHNEECILSNEVRERERKERVCGCFIDCVVEYQCSNRCSRCVSRDHQQQSKGKCDILKSRFLLVSKYACSHDLASSLIIFNSFSGLASEKKPKNKTQSSGAYIFRPASQTPLPVNPTGSV